MQIVFENTIKMATFVAPDGIIYYSRLMRDEVNILRVDEYTQTEILELEDLEDFE